MVYMEKTCNYGVFANFGFIKWVLNVKKSWSRHWSRNGLYVKTNKLETSNKNIKLII